ncbi:MAG: hypothetical protein F6K31_03995 [Symploca sp. SIO2G7]|nr:hypothetical protein [Symploca sp. SIO2G7]
MLLKSYFKIKLISLERDAPDAPDGKLGELRELGELGELGEMGELGELGRWGDREMGRWNAEGLRNHYLPPNTHW